MRLIITDPGFAKRIIEKYAYSGESSRETADLIYRKLKSREDWRELTRVQSRNQYLARQIGGSPSRGGWPARTDGPWRPAVPDVNSITREVMDRLERELRLEKMRKGLL